MIPFNKPYLTGNEINYISEAHAIGQLSGDGVFTKKCSEWLQINLFCKKVLLTHSCTAALEMAAILADIQNGDEIIMPSFTFVSTPNAFVIRGGVPVFIDIRPDTLNINENLIESAITNKTKAIVIVHYAGVACEMDKIMEIAKKYNLIVIEDAAQGLMSTYKGKALGTIGDFGCISFHETKNIISGEGGALLINNTKYSERAEIIREKGTNRSQYFRGQVDKYSWVDIGSSYLPGEIIAAFLWAQLQESQIITDMRLNIWSKYSSILAELKEKNRIVVPTIPDSCKHNGHMYYLLLNDLVDRTIFIQKMKDVGVQCVFHYIPLHNSVAGKKYSKAIGNMEVTNDISDRLVRLPLWVGLMDEGRDIIIKNAFNLLK
jgi:dTDP-4-amino-4,6-dideoxygalactose transaminase